VVVQAQADQVVHLDQAAVQVQVDQVELLVVQAHLVQAEHLDQVVQVVLVEVQVHPGQADQVVLLVHLLLYLVRPDMLLNLAAHQLLQILLLQYLNLGHVLVLVQQVLVKD
jgi:hypothetical protein